MQWLGFPDDRFAVNGLGWWEETRPLLQRLPERYREQVRPPVWDLAQDPSGGRIRFRTASPSLAVRAHYPAAAYMNNMTRIGQSGIDLYVDEDYWRAHFPPQEGDVEFLYFEGLPTVEREICLNLPLYAPTQVTAIGLAEGAQILPPTPFAVDKPVVYYGSSIDQGGCSTRPGLSYQAIVSRALNLDFINLGFSGNGLGEPELAQALVELDASCYVVAFAQNCPSPEYLKEVYAPFLQVLREQRPDTPVVCLTPIFSAAEVTNPADTRNDAMREVIRQAVSEREAQGDTAITLVEGYDLLGPDDREGLVDQAHPNDIGFMCMAAGLEPVLREVLDLGD